MDKHDDIDWYGYDDIDLFPLEDTSDSCINENGLSQEEVELDNQFWEERRKCIDDCEKAYRAVLEQRRKERLIDMSGDDLSLDPRMW
jgi:hypothetical protein